MLVTAKPTTVPAGEFVLEVPPTWEHRGNETRLVLNGPNAEVIATVLTGWPEGNVQMRGSATKTAIRAAKELAKNEELGKPEVHASPELWWSISRAKDGTFFGQLVATGSTTLLYLTYESLGEHDSAEQAFKKLVDCAAARSPLPF